MNDTTPYEHAFPSATAYVTSRWGTRPSDERKRLADAYRAGFKNGRKPVPEARSSTPVPEPLREGDVCATCDREVDAFADDLGGYIHPFNHPFQARQESRVPEPTEGEWTALDALWAEYNRVLRWADVSATVYRDGLPIAREAVEQAIARQAAAPLEARVAELERELAQAREALRRIGMTTVYRYGQAYVPEADDAVELRYFANRELAALARPRSTEGGE